MYFDTNAYDQYEESHKESTTFWRKVTHSYSLAYLDFLSWGIQHPAPQKSSIKLALSGRNKRYTNMLYDFFQSKGLVINVTGTLKDKQAVYTFQIGQDANANYQLTDPEELTCTEYYLNRYDAETAAFKLAFTVLNKWIIDQHSYGFRLR
ncbi:hypothetical protein [Xanthocytophaga agilis]|uniref:Uncharacterized protein n=1 Tax=Xanthocytophaga agilis TaxID=3048010 RepID=A0AAE3UHF1_9BACT|nr:hypothetical protein [Xanthocytophaga agilis]MDJ1503402.1 hypothetical protein [Xanthocytophaga agilis]